LKPKAMDNKIKPSQVYIVVNLNNAWNQEEYTTTNEAENNPQWGEKFVAIELLHIVKTNHRPTFEDPPIYKPKNDQHYYVDMPQSPIVIEQHPTYIDVVDLDKGSRQWIFRSYCKKISCL